MPSRLLAVATVVVVFVACRDGPAAVADAGPPANAPHATTPPDGQRAAADLVNDPLTQVLLTRLGEEWRAGSPEVPPRASAETFAGSADAVALQAALQLIVDAADQLLNEGTLTRAPADSAGA